jgi:Arc/MetJ family transcription regulator
LFNYFYARFKVLNPHREAVMRTNIVIDDDLLNEAFSVSDARTKKDLIHEALTEFIRIKKRKDLTELAGSIEFYKNYDHKKMRKLRE